MCSTLFYLICNYIIGILGLLCVPLLRGDGKGLLFVWTLESLELLCWNMVGMVANVVWTGVTTGLVFWVLNRYNMLRVEMEHEFKVNVSFFFSLLWMLRTFCSFFCIL